MALRNLLVLPALLVLAGSAAAQPSETRVAVYAPWAGPSTADERFAFGSKLAEAITTAGLGTAKVMSFAKLEDFRRALAAGTVDVALIDAGATDALGARLKVTASWSSGDRWILAGTSRPTRLRGARLALQAADAPSSARLVARMLRQQMPTGGWSQVAGAPVTADARQLVLRDGADVVVVPKREATGLIEIADLGSFSELALAVRRPESAAVSVAIQGAVRARMGGSWRPEAPRLPAPIAPARLESAASAVASLSFLELLAPAERAPPAIDVDEMWIDRDAE